MNLVKSAAECLHTKSFSASFNTTPMSHTHTSENVKTHHVIAPSVLLNADIALRTLEENSGNKVLVSDM